MSRHFPDFLTAFEEYALDGFVPDRFYQWVGRSILAAAVERKVTLKQGRIYHTPNIFVMLVAHPAVGKSTAIDAGVDLIERMRQDFNPNFKIIPNQATEPGLIDLMKITERVQISPTAVMPHSSGYFYASEASASALQNTCGDFVAAMTAFYDCPKWFRKKLKGEKETTEIENSCMNLLAGATFNYLKTLVNEQSVLGGFASRLIYVVSPERKVREARWGAGREYDTNMARKLVEDLAEINKLIGPMKPTPGFIARWEDFQPKFDRFLIDLDSEKHEAIMSRKGTNLLKLCMILSISESNNLTVTEHHFDRALEIIEDAYKDNPMIIAAAAMADKNSQTGINEVFFHHLKKNGGRMPKKSLMGAVLANGNEPDKTNKTFEQMLSSNWITFDISTGMVDLIYTKGDFGSSVVDPLSVENVNDRA